VKDVDRGLGLAVGEKGALTNYGKPTKAEFDYKRT